MHLTAPLSTSLLFSSLIRKHTTGACWVRSPELSPVWLFICWSNKGCLRTTSKTTTSLKSWSVPWVMTFIFLKQPLRRAIPRLKNWWRTSQTNCQEGHLVLTHRLWTARLQNSSFALRPLWKGPLESCRTQSPGPCMGLDGAQACWAGVQERPSSRVSPSSLTHPAAAHRPVNSFSPLHTWWEPSHSRDFLSHF